jgi:hypothetical protein
MEMVLGNTLPLVLAKTETDVVGIGCSGSTLPEMIGGIGSG